MPSWNHEGVIELFRHDARLAAELSRGPLALELPNFAEARVESGALTQMNPAELRADLVIWGPSPSVAMLISSRHGWRSILVRG
jgi:hypothetical protein